MTLTETLFAAWFMLGGFAVVVRPKMVWQEEHKPYRAFLLVVILPFGLFIRAVAHIAWLAYGVVRNEIQFHVKTFAGEDPEEK